MGRATLIMLLGSLLTFGIVTQSINTRLQNGLQTSVNFYKDAQNRDINNSVAEWILSQIASDTSYRTTSPVTLSLLGGTAEYTVQNSVFNGEKLIRISITSTFMNFSKSLLFYMSKTPPIIGYIPPFVSNAVNLRNQRKTSEIYFKKCPIMGI